MPISRGSIHHSIREDLWALFLSLLDKKSCEAATKKTILNTTYKIKTFFGTSEAVLFPYARTSLYALLRKLNIPKGSEILMTPFNIYPMLDVIRNLELKPTFIDINLEDFGPNYSELESSLSRKPYCFFLTYLFGYVPNMDYILNLCKKYDVILIEDISHSIGSKYKNQYLGTFGYASIYSSSLTKYVDSFCGSFVLTNDLIFSKKLISFYETLSKPSIARIRKIILKTLFWNISLSSIGFNFFVYPVLCFLRTIQSPLFKQITEPKVLQNKRNKLMKFYFEKITNIQCKYMVFYLNKLNNLLDARTYKVKIIVDELKRLFSIKKLHYPKKGDILEDKYENNWQFLFAVFSRSESQRLLFNKGVETGITKLPNLAESEKIFLKNATTLKEKFIFIPIHNNINPINYKNLFKVLLNNNQIKNI